MVATDQTEAYMSEFRKTGLNILLIISIFYICNAAAEMHIGTNFWFLCSWTGEQPFKTGVDFSTTDDPWNPVFLDEIEIYSTLRFMDWMTTNWSGQSRWDQRTLKTDAIQEGRTNGGSQNQADGRTTWGVAYEWLINLCNRNNSYIWVTIPHLTVSPSDLNQLSNDFSVKLAILMKHGIDMKDVDVLSMGDLSDKTAGELLAAGGVKTCDPLASHLKIYLEYSNETWNGMFAQSGYCNSKGMEMGLPGTPNEWYAGWAYHVYAAVRVWSAFERVFGEDDPRLMRVIAGQVGWGGGDVCRHQIVSLEDPAVNPDALNADAWAGAPYMGVNSVAELKSDIPNTIQMCKNNIQWIQSRDIKYINYEGGQH